MIWCDLLSAVSVFVVLLTIHYGSWQSVYLVAFISAILSQFSQPSSMRLFKYHVSEEQLRGDGFIPIADGHLHGPWPYARHIRLQHVWP